MVYMFLQNMIKVILHSVIFYLDQTTLSTMLKPVSEEYLGVTFDVPDS